MLPEIDPNLRGKMVDKRHAGASLPGAWSGPARFNRTPTTYQICYAATDDLGLATWALFPC